MPPYSARISAIYLMYYFRLAKFVWVPFADQYVQCLATKQNAQFTEGVRKLWSYFKPFVDQVHEILGKCRRPLELSNALPDCLCHVSFRKYSPLSLRVIETEQMWKFFGPQFSWEGPPRLFYGRLLPRFTVHGLVKFGWVPFVDLRLRSLAMK